MSIFHHLDARHAVALGEGGSILPNE
jgi:hypothetical protein